MSVFRCIARVVVATLVLGPVLASGKGAPNVQRNYGILGNAIAFLIDNIQGRSNADSDAKGAQTVGALAFDEKPDTDSAEGPQLPNTRLPNGPNVQRNYGILGNAIASLIDYVRGPQRAGTGSKRVGISDLDGSVPRGGIFSVGSSVPRGKLATRPGGQRSFGPLGNLIAYLVGGTPADTQRVSVDDADPKQQASSKVPAEAAKRPPMNAQVALGSKSLFGLRQLIRVLWSNFLPDPTFAAAAEQFKSQDKLLPVDSAPGSGFITASLRETILARAEGCGSIICVQ